MNEEELVVDISAKVNISKENIIELVNAKEAEFGGLVSRLGAVYIVGKELGVDLAKPLSKELKIKNIVPDMKSVAFVGKIVDIMPLKEFDTESGKGYVLNVILGDETGFIRLSLWDDRAKEAVDKLEIGQVWQIVSGYTKKDNLGNAEVRLGKWGNLKKIDLDIKVAELSKKKSMLRGEYKKITLDKIDIDELVEVKAHLLQINERPPLHYFCPACRKKIEIGQKCPDHKEATPEILLILSGVIDDGYGTTQVVFFRNAAENLVSLKTAEIENLIKSKGAKAFFDIVENIVGEYFEMGGAVKRNKLTGAAEITVHRLKKVNTKEEIAQTLQKEAQKHG